MLRIVKFLILITPFTPKLAFGVPIYAVELLIIALLAHKRTLILSHYSRFLFVGSLFSVVSFLISAIATSYFPVAEIFLIIKYILPIFLYSYLVQSNAVFSSGDLNLLVYFIGANFIVVILNYVLNDVSIASAMWGYSHFTRVIGLTGLELGPSGLKTLGNNSVAFGVFIALIIIVFIEHSNPKSIKNALLLILLLGALIFTYSRSGVVVLMGYLILKSAMVSFKMRLSIWLLYFIVFLVPPLYAMRDYLGVLSKISSYSNFSDASSNIRLGYWVESLTIWTANGWNFVFGTGYSESFQYYSFGFANSESLFFTSLVQGGMIGTMLLVCLFASLVTKNTNRLDPHRRKLAIAINYFVPCWMLANLVGGDLLHTDFLIYPVILIFASLQNGNDTVFSR